MTRRTSLRSAATCVLPLAIALGCEPAEPAAPEAPGPETCPEGFASEGAFCVQEALPPLRVIHEHVELADDEAVRGFCERGNAVAGDLVLGEAVTDVAGLACLQQVGGTLRVDGLHDLLQLSLPSLLAVGDELSVQANAQLTSLEFPRLEWLGNLAVQFAPQLGAAWFPSLREVGGYISFYKNDALELIEAPALLQVGGQRGAPENDVFYVRINPAVQRISAPELAVVTGVLKISANDSLAELDLPSLRVTEAGFYASFNESLDSLWLPLEQTEGFVYIDRTFASSVELPELQRVGQNFSVLGNCCLERIRAPRLASIGGPVEFRNNPSLPPSEVADFVDGVGAENIAGPILTEDGP